jgi:hypothetical protein
MAKRHDPEPIVRLLPELAHLAADRGFAPLSPGSQWTGKYNIVTWVRSSWNTDSLRLGWRKPPVARYFLDAQWSIPRPGQSDVVAAGLNAGHARRGLRDFALPTPQDADSWHSNVLEDAIFALAWLDRCSARDGAFEELRRPTRNGPGAGSETYAYIEEYVRAHAQ